MSEAEEIVLSELSLEDLYELMKEDLYDGLAEEIIDSLCCVRGLRVASRTASFRFRDGKTDPREIGRQLGVDAILEGSVRKAGNQLRITAQLIDAASDAHLWAESYGGTLDDIFNIQDEIANAIVTALRGSLTTSTAAAAVRCGPRGQ